MFYVNLNEIESIEYRRALNVYHYIITHNEDFRTLHKVVEPNTLIKPKVIDFSRITKFGYRLVKLSNGYYTYAYKEYGKYKISNFFSIKTLPIFNYNINKHFISKTPLILHYLW